MHLCYICTCIYNIYYTLQKFEGCPHRQNLLEIIRNSYLLNLTRCNALLLIILTCIHIWYQIYSKHHLDDSPCLRKQKIYNDKNACQRESFLWHLSMGIS